MNIFRFIGDATHLTTMIGLLLYIWKKGSCIGISGRTQVLFGILFSARYIDLFTDFVSVYNTCMKVFYLSITYVTILSIYFRYRETYNKEHDTMRCEILVIGAAVIALFVNLDFTVMEISWAFSEYLEAVAIIPQLYLVSKAGKAEKVVSYYVFGLAAYRSFYILNWGYRYYYEYRGVSMISSVPAIIQILIYFDYFFALFSSRLISKHQESGYVIAKNPVYVLSNDALLASPQKGSPVQDV